MTTFLAVFCVVFLFSVVYFLMLLAMPRCPHCHRGRMKYSGEDENGREVWICTKCGEKVLL